MKKALLITLGHNSSAVFIDESGNTIGYEQERIDGIKSSSRFPSGAIARIQEKIGLFRLLDSQVYVSHWFDSSFNVTKYFTKYMSETDLSNLQIISRHNPVKFVNNYFTHHDAHAYSALMFFNSNLKHNHVDLFVGQKTHIIVADGFGTDSEAVSIYETLRDKVTLIKRVSGYDYSLGLMYQYATSFCGMKENQDEYKFLGYEPMIEQFVHEKWFMGLEQMINMVTSNMLVPYETDLKSQYKPSDNKYDCINFEHLIDVKIDWHNTFKEVCAICDCTKEEVEKMRIIIAYFIQQVIEGYMKHVIKKFSIKNVLLAGGLFYNVKLNNSILRSVEGLFSVMPLAGDQGAAFGMYYKDNNDYKLKSLKLGYRNNERILEEFKKMKFNGLQNIHLIHRESDADCEEAIVYISDLIESGRIVNIIQGSMEFGPRALCNTSSVFLPTKKLVAHNNAMNKRNEVMPCAPIIRIEDVGEMFDTNEMRRVVGSDDYMICTHRYKQGVEIHDFYELHSGVMHKETLVDDTYTGRPQVVYPGEFMHDVLTRVHEMYGLQCMLVNTSFNAHGRPIVFDTMDIVHNFMFQYSNADATNKPHLVILI